MSSFSLTNIGGPEHIGHLQLDEFDADGTHRVHCQCGVTFTAEGDHSEHRQVTDFDAGLVHCDCGASWAIGSDDV